MASEEQEDFRVLTKTQDSFRKYAPVTVQEFVSSRRANLAKLVRSPEPNDKTAYYIEKLQLVERLDEMESCIQDNQFFLDQVTKMADHFVDQASQTLMTYGNENKNIHENNENNENHQGFIDPAYFGVADDNDHTKIRASLRQLVREWSADGAEERAQSYGVVINELLALYPDVQVRHQTKVLVPGCGLGRLPFELCYHGFQTQGNEFSYHMLFISSFMLNATSSRNEYRIRPFIHSFSHSKSRHSRVREVLIPDVNPRVLVDHMDQDKGIPADGLMSMAAGSFDEIYPPKDSNSEDDLFDVVTTLFFIDTSPNIVKTIQTIYNTLKKGGYWINFGPLLWHHETDPEVNGFELSMDDILGVLVPELRFKVLKQSTHNMCRYSTDPYNSSGYIYDCDMWLAQKI